MWVALAVLGAGVFAVLVRQQIWNGLSASRLGTALPGNSFPPDLPLPWAVLGLVALGLLGGTLASTLPRRFHNRWGPIRRKDPVPRKGWRWVYDRRVLATIVALGLIGCAFMVAPRGRLSGLGDVSGGLQGAIARPESGFPRIRVPRVRIDLLLVKGDGRTPPVKYEAFTYPGVDHLLTGTHTGGSNSFIYAHGRTGMFWRLHDLRIGDSVEVDYGGGKVLHYRLSEIHPTVGSKDLRWLQPSADDRLTLQTCNGWQDQDPRFIVVARRVQDRVALSR